MTFTACTAAQFNDLPHTRWVSLPRRNEVKVGGNTVGIKVNGEYSYRMYKTHKEAREVFESLVSQLY